MKLRTIMGAALFLALGACAGVGTDGPGSPEAGPQDGGADSGANANIPISAADFDQACVEDSDCSPVTEGNVCALCSCPSAAIARSAEAAYEAKWRELASGCGARPGIGCQADCVTPEAWCSSGTCAFGARGEDAGTDADAP